MPCRYCDYLYGTVAVSAPLFLNAQPQAASSASPSKGSLPSLTPKGKHGKHKGSAKSKTPDKAAALVTHSAHLKFTVQEVIPARSPAPSLIHSLPQSATHPLTHPPILVHSPTHPPPHSPTHARTHAHTHALQHSLTRSLIPLLLRSLNHYITDSLTCSLAHPVTHPPTHSPTHLPKLAFATSVVSASASQTSQHHCSSETVALLQLPSHCMQGIR